MGQWSGLINVAMTEFLEGRLEFEVNGRRLRSSGDVQTTERLENEKRLGPDGTRERGKGKLHPQAEDLEISRLSPWAVNQGKDLIHGPQWTR